MKMLNRQHIAPRVQVMTMRRRFTGQPLTKDELAQVLCALQKTGIDDCFNRICDDTSRYLIDQLLDQI